MLIIEYENCGGWAVASKPPQNNKCPVCLHLGSLYIQIRPDDMQKRAPKENKSI